jgi:hypothetical protein
VGGGPEPDGKADDLVFFLEGEVLVLPLADVAQPLGEVKDRWERRGVLAIAVVGRPGLEPDGVVVRAEAKENGGAAEVVRGAAGLREIVVIDLGGDGGV